MFHTGKHPQPILPDTHHERIELVAVLHKFDETEFVPLTEREFRLLEKLEWATFKNIQVEIHGSSSELIFNAQLTNRGGLAIELLTVAGPQGAGAVLQFLEQLAETRQAWLADPESVRLVLGSIRSEELPPTLTRLTEMLRHYQWIEPHEAVAVAKAFEGYHATVALVTENDPNAVKDARDWFEKVAKPDVLPYYSQSQIGSGDPKADRVYTETLQVMRRAIDLHLGFSSLMYDCKRSPAKRECVLAQFAQDCAEKLEVIYSESNDFFPGRGYRIRGLKPRTLFIADAAHDSDPYHRYKSAYPWARDEFDILNVTDWYFLRGCIVVTTEAQSPELCGARYSYIVYNEHFLPHATVGALLVPTKVIETKLMQCAVSFHDYVGSSRYGLDANDLTPETLRRESEALGLPIFDLTWGSNFNGGLCNAATPGNFFFHPWEDYKFRFSRDIWGHGHKIYATDIMNERLNRSYEDSDLESPDFAMKLLRDLHAQVYNIAHRYQNLFDLFRLGLGVWRKGIVPAPLTNTNRLLQGCYQLHDDLMHSGAEESEFPIMAMTPMFSYSKMPSRELLIDLFTLEIVHNGRRFSMPSLNTLSSRDAARTLWKDVVLAHLPYNYDLRSYDRNTFLEGVG
jgi:hypothetical protein